MSKELTLREIQLSSLEILKYIDKICRKEGLKYYLAYGTLIGAVRHKGFIPWDDDIDIWMPREDYEKLAEYCIKNDIGGYRLFTKDDKDYPYIIPRFSDTRYRMAPKNEKECGMGTFVDIYLLENLGDDYKRICKNKKKNIHYASLYFLSTRKKFEIGHTKGILRRILKIPAYVFAKMVGRKYFGKRIETFRRKAISNGDKYMGVLIWGTHIHKDIFEQKLFKDGIRIKFEDSEFLAPVEYKTVLGQIYGDYMKIPKKSERIAHHDYKIFMKGVK